MNDNDINIIEIKIMEFILGILASVVANNLPTIRELVERNKTLQQKLDDCFEKAVESWSAPQELKQSTLLNSVRFTSKLKDYIEHPERGMHSFDKELMRLWVEAIMGDADCSTYILSIKDDLILAIQKDGIQNVLEHLEKMMQEQNEANHKINDLWRRGGKTVKQFWDEVSILEKGEKQLPYSTIMGGRVSEAETILKATEISELVVIESQSRLESKAFAAAAILNNGGHTDNVIVVENRDLYDQLVNGGMRYVIITSIVANHQLAVAKGHSVIYCVGPRDNYVDDHIVLPEIDRNVFISSLKESGLNDDEVKKLALDSAKDINILWRMLGVVMTPPAWETDATIMKFIPIMLVGRWDEASDADRQLLKELSGSESYEAYRRDINAIILADESPLKKIGTVFVVKSLYAMYKRYFRYVTDVDIERFLEYADVALEDVDKDAIAKMESQELQYWRANRMFSSDLRKGIVEGLALIALMQEDAGRDKSIERWLSTKLKEFDLQKYLSHRHNMQWIAEASPKAFLEFIENDIQKGSPILNEIFVIRPNRFGLTDTQIFYTELLFGLECIAWNEDYLPQVTQILLHLCAYKNDSNWDNRPSHSLERIYRFVMPCTCAPLGKRITILRSLQRRYPDAVHDVCLSWLKGLNSEVYFTTQNFRWRWSAQRPDYYSKGVQRYPANDQLREMYEMMMTNFEWREDNIVELLELSMYQYMKSLRKDIIDSVRARLDGIKGNDTICKELREEIYRHWECQDTWWSLKGEDLQLYRDLLHDLTLQDVINANKHLFDDIYLNDPDSGIDYLTENSVDKTMKYRAKIEEKIIKERGLNGIWELEKVAKSGAAVASGFAELTGDQYRVIVYERYCNGGLSKAFVKQYFSNLYYMNKDDKEAYASYIREMMEKNPDRIAVVMYAPGFYREYADMVESLSDTISLDYWQNVQRSGVYGSEDVPLIIDRLIRSKRYGDVLFFMSQKEVLAMMSSKQKVEALYAIFRTEGLLVMSHQAYHVGRILDTVELDGDMDMERKVESMEFYLYKRLEHYLKDEHNHFRKAINTKPELLMEIISAIFQSEVESEEPIIEEERGNREFMWHIAHNFWYNYHDVPCSNADGSIDGTKLRKYLRRIDEIAKERHREYALPFVIGKILGNFPEDEDYPSQLLCDLVEEYSDDAIDTEIGCAIHNRRSFSTRSPFAGGTVERNHIETLQKYRERAVLRSLRFVKILDSAIRGFERSAKQNDYEGQMNNFEY